MSYRYLTLLCLSVMFSGCVNALAPSSAATTLVVLTYERGTNYPLQTLVTYNNSASTQTDASGYVVIKAPLHVESVVRVEREGYGPMEAAAVLESAERWSFYLERLQ